MPHPDRPPRQETPQRPRWPWVVLALYLVGMAVAVGWPDGWAVDRFVLQFYLWGLQAGIPPAFGPPQWGTLLNVLACIPPVAAVLVLLPRTPWWAWVVGGALLSVAVELVQGRIGRHPDPADVLANTVGALLGAAVGVLLRRRTRGRTAGEA